MYSNEKSICWFASNSIAFVMLCVVAYMCSYHLFYDEDKGDDDANQKAIPAASYFHSFTPFLSFNIKPDGLANSRLISLRIVGQVVGENAVLMTLIIEGTWTRNNVAAKPKQ